MPSPRRGEKDKRQKMSESFNKDEEEEEEEDDDMTGMMGIMKQFKKDAKMSAANPLFKNASSTLQESLTAVNQMKLNLPQASGRDKKSSFLQESLRESASFMDKPEPATPHARPSFMEGNKSNFGLASFAEGGVPSPLLETSAAPQLDVTKTSGDDDVFQAPPAADRSELGKSSLTSFANASPQLDCTGATAAATEVSKQGAPSPNLDRSSFQTPQVEVSSVSGPVPDDDSDMDEDEEGLAAPTAIELSTEEPPEPMSAEEMALQEDITRNVSKLSLVDLETVQDPFDEALQIVLLGRVPKPVSERHGYFRVPGKMPRVISNREVCCREREKNG